MDHTKKLAIMLILATVMVIGYVGALHFSELPEHPYVCQNTTCYFDENGNLVGWEPTPSDIQYMVYRLRYGDDFLKDGK